MQFQQYILTDDNAYPIEVLECLKYAEGHKGAFRRTCNTKVNEVNTRLDLNKNEINRITNHSIAAANYYRLILESGQYNADLSKELTDARRNLAKELLSDTYEVTASFGKDGDELLRRRLLENRDDLFADREHLVTYMAKHLKREEWKIFLRGFKTGLGKILLGDDSFRNILNSESPYNGEDAHDRAVLFCMAEHYRQERDQGGMFMSIFARLTGYAWSKQDKEYAVEILEDFLVSNRALTELKNYIEVRIQDKVQQDKVTGALYERNSRLKDVVDRVGTVGTQVAEHHQAAGKMHTTLRQKVA
jgi:hypothetical protein